MPAWWIAAPAAAAAIALFAGLWATVRSTEPAPTPLAGVRVELVSGPEWAGVMQVAADTRATGPAGAVVEQIIDSVAEEGR